MEGDAREVVDAYRSLRSENAELKAEVARLRREADGLRIELAAARTEERGARESAASAHSGAQLAQARLDSLWSATRSDVRAELLHEVRAELRAELAPAVAAELEAPLRARMEAERDAQLAAALQRMRHDFDAERAQLLAKLTAERLNLSERAAAQLRDLSDAVAQHADQRASEREARLHEDVRALATALREPRRQSEPPALPPPAPQPAPTPALAPPTLKASGARGALAACTSAFGSTGASGGLRQRRLLDSLGPRQRAKLRRELLQADAADGAAHGDAPDDMAAATSARSERVGHSAPVCARSDQSGAPSTFVAAALAADERPPSSAPRAGCHESAAAALARERAPPAAAPAVAERRDPVEQLSLALHHERAVRASLERLVADQLGGAVNAAAAPPAAPQPPPALSARNITPPMPCGAVGGWVGTEAMDRALSAPDAFCGPRRGSLSVASAWAERDGTAHAQPSAWAAQPPATPSYAQPRDSPSVQTPVAARFAHDGVACGASAPRSSHVSVGTRAQLGKLAVAAAEQRIARLSQAAVDAAYGSHAALEAFEAEHAAARWVELGGYVASGTRAASDASYAHARLRQEAEKGLASLDSEAHEGARARRRDGGWSWRDADGSQLAGKEGGASAWPSCRLTLGSESDAVAQAETWTM
ncbi:hypothetical protein KFE25_004028 [Diacronema lutheri]|uniref:Uncharacterized protein n=1 Tax=Diacronema lutheri TaxID=2081491 RepID=A0A8J5XIB3_DIALT|nr:hypothetical protein KFE25_004028 [Diacronema lutheri]